MHNIDETATYQMNLHTHTHAHLFNPLKSFFCRRLFANRAHAQLTWPPSPLNCQVALEIRAEYQFRCVLFAFQNAIFVDERFFDTLSSVRRPIDSPANFEIILECDFPPTPTKNFDSKKREEKKKSKAYFVWVFFLFCVRG